MIPPRAESTQTVTGTAGHRGFVLTGIPALLLLLVVVALIVAVIRRVFVVGRHARVASAGLAAREAQYRLLFEHNPCAMWTYDDATLEILDVNNAAITQYGYTREEFISMTLRDLRAPEDADRLEEMLRERDHTATTTDLMRHRRRDGTSIDVEVRGQPLHSPGRQARLVVATDVTNRLHAEARAKANSEMVQAVIDAAPQAIVVTDAGSHVVRWNNAAQVLLGWRADEVLGKVAPHTPDDQREQFLAERTLAELGQSGRTIEVECLRKDESRVHVLLATAPLREVDGSITAYVSVLTDLTERLRQDEQLRQSQKMEAVGRLAGGIAHDFNNILTVITSYAGILLDEARDEQTRGDLGEIALAAQRAKALTTQLLAFSRRDVVVHKSVNASKIVTGMEAMLRRLVNSNIALVSKVRADIGGVMADPSQIEQLVMNLVVNAADAMPNGGTLVMETDNTELDAAYAQAHSEVIPGPYVLLAVTDTGTGMDEATMTKVFEPFFTTKGLGRGTGLGLATVYSIVKRLGGHVWIYSEVGLGTTFKIYLPRTAAAVQSTTSEFFVEPVAWAGRRTVLLFEDDAAVRRIVRPLLEDQEYVVLEATDGAHGLAVVAESGGTVDLVVTDLMMPNMNGRELAERLAVTNPGLRVLLTSGYTDDAVIRRGLMESAHAFLQKPFSAEQLTQAIGDLCGHPRDGAELAASHWTGR